jgi:hypothetical protein
VSCLPDSHGNSRPERGRVVACWTTGRAIGNEPVAASIGSVGAEALPEEAKRFMMRH